MSYQQLENERKREYERGVLMSELRVPKQLLEVFEKTKIRKEMRDNAARVCNIIIERGGKKPFCKEYVRVAIEAFGVRRNSVRGTLDYLIDNDVIQCDWLASNPKMPKHNRKNFGPNRSNGYRFAPAISTADVVSYELQANRPPRKTAAAPPSPCVRECGQLTATQKILAAKMTQFDVDEALLKKLEVDLLSTVEVTQLKHYATQFRQKQYFASSASTGRLFTTFTSCPKALRSVLCVNGESMAELDASCCNPLLCCRLMANAGFEPAQYADFQTWTEGGTLYCEIAGALNTSRDTVKELILTYFCGPHEFDEARLNRQLADEKDSSKHPQITADFRTLQKIARWFQTSAPAVDKFLANQKKPSINYWKKANAIRKQTGQNIKGPHAVISQQLQKLESEVVIEDCCKNIFANNPDVVISTVHDCLLVPKSFVETAKAEFIRSFASLGLKPTIKTSFLTAV